MADDEPTSITSTRRNPLDQVSDSVFRYVVHCLYKDVLPPNITDPSETRLIIDAGIAAVASMIPANADEANIAVRVVTADANASACIGYAHQLAAAYEFVAAGKCRAQANHFHRTANAARALLLRVQAARRKREADRTTCDQDAWQEHCVAGLMVAATNGAATPEPPSPPPVVTSGPAPRPRPGDDPATPPPTRTVADDDDKFAHYDIAEQYAAIYPRRAAEIRAHGGIPSAATWGRPDPETVEALLASTSPLVLQADQEFAQAAA
jgi:hypothetical protein